MGEGKSASTYTIDLRFPSTAVSSPERYRHDMPVSVSRDQAYYWSAEWQAGVAESRAALERGDYYTFPNAAEAIRWLMSDDEPPNQDKPNGE